MKGKIFIDTNILVRLTNEDDPVHSKVEQTFSELEKENEIWISRQVLREYAVVMTREGMLENPLTPEMVSDDIEKWILLFEVADETDEVTIKLQEIIKKYSLKGKIIHDGNIVATMMANSIKKIFTLNKSDFKRFKKEVEVVDLRADSSEENKEKT